MWILEVPVTKSIGNTHRVIKLLNAALANLNLHITELNISEEDVVCLTAEWTVFKSEGNLKCGAVPKSNLIEENLDDFSIRKKHQLLSDDAESDVVVPYCYGGGYM